MAKFKPGDRVYILGQWTILQFLFSKLDGGWKVQPSVNGCQYWGEDDMTPETKGRELVQRLYESDEASALTNEAARFIEGMLKND